MSNLIPAFAELRAATLKARKANPNIGTAVSKGAFVVTETIKTGRSWKTRELAGPMAHSEVIAYLNAVAA